MYRRRSYRRVRRTRRVPRGIGNAVLPIRRVSAISSIPLAAGINTGTVQFTLNAVTISDLQAVFQEYRIRKVDCLFSPRFDPGNSGVVNNAQLHIICASDTDALAAANTITLGAYANAKVGSLVAGRTFKYTVYPKVSNSVSNGSTAVAAGTYATNPWLLFNATGITIPHYQLMWSVESTLNTVVTNFDVQYVFYFDVRGFN